MLNFVAYDPHAYSRFKFLDQYNTTSIPIWTDNNGNKSEWGAASRLQSTQSTIDKWFYNLNSITVYKMLKVDKAGMRFTYSFRLQRSLVTELYTKQCMIQMEYTNKSISSEYCTVRTRLSETPPKPNFTNREPTNIFAIFKRII